MRSASGAERKDERPEPIPVVVVAGFLGAGKTTVLERLIHQGAPGQIRVLVNEFSQIGLDHLYLNQDGNAAVLLDSGCLCCSARDGLSAALEQILRDLDNGRAHPFGRLVIETTGLADPIPVLRLLTLHPYFSQRFRTQGVLTVVDAIAGPRTLARYPEALRQVRCADVILVTKTDLLGALDQGQSLIASFEAHLRGLNPAARIFDANDATAHVLESFDAKENPDHSASRLQAEWAQFDGSFESIPNFGVLPLTRNKRNQMTHGAIASHGFRSRSVIHSENALAFCERVRQQFGADLLRMKGIIKLVDDPTRPAALHAVQDFIYPMTRLKAWPSSDQDARIAIIVRDSDPVLVEKIWNSYAGLAEPATNNPLLPSQKSSRNGLF